MDRPFLASHHEEPAVGRKTRGTSEHPADCASFRTALERPNANLAAGPNSQCLVAARKKSNQNRRGPLIFNRIAFLAILSVPKSNGTRRRARQHVLAVWRKGQGI